MPKRDDETGIAPVAADGEPDPQWADDEIERRRQLKEAREREEEAQVTGKRGAPIDGQSDVGEQVEAFPMGVIDGDHKTTMKNIVPAGKARKTEAKMRATPIPMRHGLVKYGDLVEYLVTLEAGKVEEVPDLEEPESGGRRTLNGVKDVQHFRPVHVRPAAGMYSAELAAELLSAKLGIAQETIIAALTATPAAAAG